MIRLNPKELAGTVKAQKATLLDLSKHRNNVIISSSDLSSEMSEIRLSTSKRVTNLDFINFAIISGNQLACYNVVGQSDLIDIWDINTCKLKATLQLKRSFNTNYDNDVHVVVMLSDGLLASGTKSQICLWNLATNQCVGFLKNESSIWDGVYDVNALAVLPNNQLASADNHGNIVLWDIKERRKICILNESKSSIDYLAVLPGGRLASAHDNRVCRTITIWDTNTKRSIANLSGHEDAIKGITALPGDRLASTSVNEKGGTLKIWDVNKNQCIQTINLGDAYRSAVASIGYSLNSTPNSIPGLEKFYDFNSKCPLVSLPDNKLAVGINIHVINESAIGIWNLTTGVWDLFIAGPQPSNQKSTIHSLILLPDGRLASSDAYGFTSLWNYKQRLAIDASHLNELFTHLGDAPLEYVNLKNTRIVDSSADKLVPHFNSLKALKEIHVANTMLKHDGLRVLYLGVKKSHPAIQLLHETGAVSYRSLFATCLETLQKNPGDTNTQRGLLATIKASHEEILTCYNEVLAHPELLTVTKIQDIFKEVCCIADFRWPYTLLNIMLAPNAQIPLESKQRELLIKAMANTLTWVAKHAVLDSDGVAAFKGLLRSLKRSLLLSQLELDKLDNEAEVSRVFADARFLDLKRQIHEIQNQLKIIVGEIKEAQVQIQALRGDIQKLGQAMKHKADRSMAFGIMKTALSLCMAAGLAQVIEVIWDYSDIIEVGASIFTVDKDKFQSLLEAGKEEFIDYGSTKLVNRVGCDPDQFIEEWYNLSVAWINCHGKSLPHTTVSATTTSQPAEKVPLMNTSSASVPTAQPVSSSIQGSLFNLQIQTAEKLSLRGKAEAIYHSVQAASSSIKGSLFNPQLQAAEKLSPRGKAEAIYRSVLEGCRLQLTCQILFKSDTKLCIERNKKDISIESKAGVKAITEALKLLGDALATGVPDYIKDWDFESSVLTLTFKTSDDANNFLNFMHSSVSGFQFMDSKVNQSCKV